MENFRTALLAAILAFTGAHVWAQSYPVKPIRLIVPYPLGGLDASSEQGSRLRDATVRESAAAAVLIAQATTPIEKYPIRPIRLIVPYLPGGATDIFARILGARLGEALGQQIVVEHRRRGRRRVCRQPHPGSPAHNQ